MDLLKRRRKAYSIVAYAKLTGKLTEEPCNACGAKAEAHHNDYDKPLEVTWLCRSHHRMIDSQHRIGRKREYAPKTKGGKILLMQ